MSGFISLAHGEGSPSPTTPILTWKSRDTVSSIGLVRRKDLPGTTDLKHTCFFRHALALDECRVKFLPEYAYGGAALPDVRAGNRSELQVSCSWISRLVNGELLITALLE